MAPSPLLEAHGLKLRWGRHAQDGEEEVQVQEQALPEEAIRIGEPSTQGTAFERAARDFRMGLSISNPTTANTIPSASSTVGFGLARITAIDGWSLRTSPTIVGMSQRSTPSPCSPSPTPPRLPTPTPAYTTSSPPPCPPVPHLTSAMVRTMDGAGCYKNIGDEDVNAMENAHCDDADHALFDSVIKLTPDMAPCDLAVICRKCFEMYVARLRAIPDTAVHPASNPKSKPKKPPSNTSNTRSYPCAAPSPHRSAPFSPSTLTPSVLTDRNRWIFGYNPAGPCAHAGPYSRHAVDYVCAASGQHCMRTSPKVPSLIRALWALRFTAPGVSMWRSSPSGAPWLLLRGGV
ncbi:hypothetical protein HYPSUDRAFT_207818 [Hypholoma sublateritium FD-334 SS-4]|uniref:Uncharacterized protein n=1 Tax=Hypholoma sublateritium (strain FD-334 SS-4) TaxID=945553 RepID=A0A0D2NFK3_HYPSF|nr:hypothetical protein HYPSUDRAFT_207818 [Hypholoma sublateritium FD-334 SS-4]